MKNNKYLEKVIRTAISLSIILNMNAGLFGQDTKDNQKNVNSDFSKINPYVLSDLDKARNVSQQDNTRPYIDVSVVSAAAQQARAENAASIVDDIIKEREQALRKKDAVKFYELTMALNARLLSYLKEPEIKMNLIGAAGLLEQIKGRMITPEDARKAFSVFEKLLKNQNCYKDLCQYISIAAMALGYSGYYYEETEKLYKSNNNEIIIIPPYKQEKAARIKLIKGVAKRGFGGVRTYTSGDLLPEIIPEFGRPEATAQVAPGLIRGMAVLGSIKDVEETVDAIIAGHDESKKIALYDSRKYAAHIAAMDTLFELGPQALPILKKYAFWRYSDTSQVHANINLAYATTGLSAEEGKKVKENIKDFYCKRNYKNEGSKGDMEIRQKLAYAYGSGGIPGRIPEYIDKAGSNECKVIYPTRPDPNIVGEEWANRIMFEVISFFAINYIIKGVQLAKVAKNIAAQNKTPFAKTFFSELDKKILEKVKAGVAANKTPVFGNTLMTKQVSTQTTKQAAVQTQSNAVKGSGTTKATPTQTRAGSGNPPPTSQAQKVVPNTGKGISGTKATNNGSVVGKTGEVIPEAKAAGNSARTSEITRAKTGEAVNNNRVTSLENKSSGTTNYDKGGNPVKANNGTGVGNNGRPVQNGPGSQGGYTKPTEGGWKDPNAIVDVKTVAAGRKPEAINKDMLPEGIFKTGNNPAGANNPINKMDEIVNGDIHIIEELGSSQSNAAFTRRRQINDEIFNISDKYKVINNNIMTSDPGAAYIRMMENEIARLENKTYGWFSSAEKTSDKALLANMKEDLIRQKSLLNERNFINEYGRVPTLEETTIVIGGGPNIYEFKPITVQSQSKALVPTREVVPNSSTGGVNFRRVREEMVIGGGDEGRIIIEGALEQPTKALVPTRTTPTPSQATNPNFRRNPNSDVAQTPAARTNPTPQPRNTNTKNPAPQPENTKPTYYADETGNVRNRSQQAENLRNQRISRQQTTEANAARERALEQERLVKEEAARIKAAEQEAARIKAAEQEAARIKAAEQEAARIKAAEQEAARIKAAEQEAVLKTQKINEAKEMSKQFRGEFGAVDRLSVETLKSKGNVLDKLETRVKLAKQYQQSRAKSAANSLGKVDELQSQINTMETAAAKKLNVFKGQAAKNVDTNLKSFEIIHSKDLATPKLIEQSLLDDLVKVDKEFSNAVKGTGVDSLSGIKITEVREYAKLYNESVGKYTKFSEELKSFDALHPNPNALSAELKAQRQSLVSSRNSAYRDMDKWSNGFNQNLEALQWQFENIRIAASSDARLISNVKNQTAELNKLIKSAEENGIDIYGMRKIEDRLQEISENYNNISYALKQGQKIRPHKDMIETTTLLNSVSQMEQNVINAENKLKDFSKYLDFRQQAGF